MTKHQLANKYKMFLANKYKMSDELSKMMVDFMEEFMSSKPTQEWFSPPSVLKNIPAYTGNNTRDLNEEDTDVKLESGI